MPSFSIKVKTYHLAHNPLPHDPQNRTLAKMRRRKSLPSSIEDLTGESTFNTRFLQF